MKKIIENTKRVVDWGMGIYDGFLKGTYKIPLTHVDKEKYLKKSFEKSVSADDMQAILETSPADICTPQKVNNIAKRSILSHAAWTSCFSFLTTIPSGWAVIPMIIIDLAQFQIHIFKISQKLLYLYKDEEALTEYKTDTSTRLMLLLSTITIGKHRIANMTKSAIGFVARQLVQRYGSRILIRLSMITALRQLCKWLGITLTKDLFEQSIDALIVIICAAISGLISYWLFVPMSVKLHKRLKEEHQGKEDIAEC